MSLVNKTISFNGCNTTMAEEVLVSLDMKAYINGLQYIAPTSSCRKKLSNKADVKEYASFRNLCDALVRIASIVLPQVVFFASSLQQRLPRLTVEHIVLASTMLR